MTCLPPCKTCLSGQPSSCTSCLDTSSTLTSTQDLYLHPEEYTCLTLPCPAGFYADQSGKVCRRCLSSCLACIDALSCSDCDAASNFPVLFNKQCVKQCPADRPLYTSEKLCKECAAICLTCVGKPENCEKCANGLFKYGSSCVEQCPQYTQPSKTDNVCAGIVVSQ